MTTPPTPPIVRGPWDELGVDLVVDEPRLRGWVEHLPVGASRPAHTHRRPWVTVVVRGGSAEVTDERGARTALDLSTGQVRFNPLDRGTPIRHALRNTGDTDLLLVAIELEE